ncbi:MAG: hypothetical protein GY925_03260 [Actinomycetia bacterium]|nr:hypothetical protein [Actinomycetes bacterium]
MSANLSTGAISPTFGHDQALLRAAIVVGGMFCLLIIRVASTNNPIVAIEVAILLGTLLSAAAPDSHVGLLVTLFIVVDWITSVEGRTSPWAMAVAASLALFHTSMAASSIAPRARTWTPAMRRRWAGRLLVAAAAGVATWLVVVLIQHLSLGTNHMVVTTGLLTLAVAASRVGPSRRLGPNDDVRP